jgi:hypothetical protein
MIRSEKIEAVAAALLQVQGALTPVEKDGKNPFLGNGYATLGGVWEAARPLLQKAGIAVVQIPEETNGESVGLTTILVHAASGQFIGGTLIVPVGTEKGKSAAQAVGSAVSYARRYGMSALLGITQEDDDGNAAGSRQQQAQRPQVRPAAQPARNPIDAAFDTMSVPDPARATLYDGALEQAHGDKALAAAAIAGWARDGYKWNEQSGTIVPKK